MSDPFAHYGQHPDVNAAIAAREKIDRITAMREREPELDLKEAVKELVEIVTILCANVDVLMPVDSKQVVLLWERAHELKERLS